MKRPSVALDPAISARAVELRADGTAREMSFRAVEAQLEREGKRASVAAIHAAVVAARQRAAPAPAEAEDPDDADAQERAESLRAIAADAVLEIQQFLRRFRATRTVPGETSVDEAGKLMSLATNAEKLARILDGKRSPGGVNVNVTQVVHTSAESSALAAARAARGV